MQENKAVYAAIYGDIAGSTLEWHEPLSTLNEKCDLGLFALRGHFTDDTVLTIATLNCMDNGTTTKEQFIDSYVAWGKCYPNAGFSKKFKESYLDTNETPIMHSSGNGCLMRASPFMGEDVGAALNSLAFTHDHVDAKFALEDYLKVCNNIKTKNDITVYTSLAAILPSYEDLLKCHKFDSNCITTLRDAYVCVLNANCLEDVYKNALCLGGDTDTIAAIAGSIGAMVFDLPEIGRAHV